MTNAEKNNLRANLADSLQIFFENIEDFYETSKDWTLSEYIEY
jgi:hypothetical protein